ncbi:MAG TPA: alpha/beta fold hydrolase [Arenicellales bacterium]|nr:alpha/beta fold hydrolase [Arenicellales bacterium]
MKQSARFLTTRDGVTLAWAAGGKGMPLVRAANWLTHLEYDWESPVWSHWMRFLAGHFHYIRYDERGCGLTDHKVGDLSFPRWVEDLEAVVDAAAPRRPFALMGGSQGASVAIAYAVRYPERVSHLILYGAYAVGARRFDDETFTRTYQAMQELVRVGWDKDNPVFRQVFTSRFIPEGTEEQIEWFNELCRRTSTPELIYELFTVRANIDVRDLLPQVQVPTLVLHAASDEVIPVEQGRKLAREIPGAEFMQLESRNHILQESEPAWRDFKEAVLRFTGQGHRADAGSRFDTLTPRESEILTLLRRGYTNARIGYELGVSEKTVRNHISRLYEKLDVHSRTEAIALAHEHGLPFA